MRYGRRALVIGLSTIVIDLSTVNRVDTRSRKLKELTIANLPHNNST